MLEQVDALEAEYAEVAALLADPDVIGDPDRLRDSGRRFKKVDAMVAVSRPLREAYGDLEAANELVELADGSERDQLRLEVGSLEIEIHRLEDELRGLLLPSDPNDGRPVILEVRGAEGGEEANLFARDLHDMYLAFAAGHGWSVEPLMARDSDMGGFSEVMVLVKGEDAWTRLKYEGGVHLVQRVPVTESRVGSTPLRQRSASCRKPTRSRSA